MDETSETSKVMDVVTNHYKLIEGRIKTLIEATVVGDRQSEAAKDIVGPFIWETWSSVKEEVEKIFKPEQAE